jgi:hypothetical protein
MSRRGRKDSKKELIEYNRITSNEAEALIKLLEKAKECSKCRRKN